MARKKVKSDPAELENPPSTRELQEFKKTNDAIGLRLRQGNLTLLGRKVFNVLMYQAQNKKKGEGAPEETETSQKFFWLPLAELIRDTRYDSNDVSIIKKHLLELQDIRICSEDAKEWVSESLLASVKLSSPKYGLKSNRGAITIGYAFPPEVERMVLNPSAYTNLSIFYQGVLRRGASLALYEICRRYATNPSKVTNKADTVWWYHALTGAPVGESAEEYRYFKRDTLKPAIAEINSVTDISIELIEHTQGRKVMALQFRVELTKQTPLVLDAPVIDSEVVRRLEALGFTNQEANQLFASTEDSRLRATLDLVERRVKNPRQSPVDSPKAYFKKALQERYATPVEVANKTVQQVKKQAGEWVDDPIAKIRNQYLAERAKHAYDMYKEMDDVVRKEKLDEFKESPDAKGINFSRGLAATPARMAFSMWLAAQTWGEPSEMDLLRYAAARAA